MQIGFADNEERTAVAQMLYYARRAGYLEGALRLIAAGTTGVDPQLAAQRALAAVGPDVLADTTPAASVAGCGAAGKPAAPALQLRGMAG